MYVVFTNNLRDQDNVQARSLFGGGIIINERNVSYSYHCGNEIGPPSPKFKRSKRSA